MVSRIHTQYQILLGSTRKLVFFRYYQILLLMALSWPEPRLEFTGHEMPWVIRLRHLHTTIRVANVIIQIPANVVDVKRVAQDALISLSGPIDR